MKTWNLNDCPVLVDLNQCISSYGIKDKSLLFTERVSNISFANLKLIKDIF